MDGDTLSLLIASTIGGLAVLLGTVSLVYQPLLLPFALPLAAAAYLMWQGALGRAGRGRIRWQRVDPDDLGRDAVPGFGAARGPAESGRHAPGDRWEATAGRERLAGDSPDRAREEAYRVLGLDPGAGDEAVKRAYREKVKEVHPDAPEGDETSFRRVKEAYETLTE